MILLFIDGDVAEWIPKWLPTILAIVSLGGFLVKIGSFKNQLEATARAAHRDIDGLREEVSNLRTGIERLNVLPGRVDLLEQKSSFGQSQREDHQKVLDKLDRLIEVHCLDTSIHVNPTHNNQRHDEMLAQFARFEQLILELTKDVATLSGELKQTREHRR